MTSAILFTAIILLIFLGLFLWTAKKTGGIREAIEYYKESQAYKDWLGLLYVPTFIMITLALISEATKGDEIRVWEYTQIHAGLEVPIEGGSSSICREQEESVDDKLTSNLGIRQHFIGWKAIDLVGGYTHHSCAIDRDQNVWDGIGMGITWTHRW